MVVSWRLLVRNNNRLSYSTAFTNQEAGKDRTEHVIYFVRIGTSLGLENEFERRSKNEILVQPPSRLFGFLSPHPTRHAYLLFEIVGRAQFGVYIQLLTDWTTT